MKKKPAILSISAKCADMFTFSFNGDSAVALEYDGYVPDFMPGDHYGDYVMLDIDISTGKILNWDAAKAKKALLA